MSISGILMASKDIFVVVGVMASGDVVITLVMAMV